MSTMNDRYQDELIRHAVETERLKGGAVDRAIGILNETEDDLEALIRTRLGRLEPGAAAYDRQLMRLNSLLKSVRDQRAATWLAFKKSTRKEMTDFAADEVGFVQRAFTTAATIEDLALVGPLTSAVKTAVTTRPFQGAPLNNWFRGLEAADQKGLERAIRTGFIEGETIDQIVRRVRGTRANKFTDGVLQITRRNAEAVVRTGITHSATQARDAVFQQNSDIILAQRWTSTLDGSTTPICQARDGKVSVPEGKPVPPGSVLLSPPFARPPAHVGCRSIMIGIVNPEGVVGNRPFVRDKATGRETRFRQMAQNKAGARWKSMTPQQRTSAMRRTRKEWANENIGTVPARTTYPQWLKRQPAAFQNEVLGGVTRGRLFRQGKLPIEKFVDRSGRRYNLKELRQREAEAFRAANINQN